LITNCSYLAETEVLFSKSSVFFSMITSFKQNNVLIYNEIGLIYRQKAEKSVNGSF
jgi:hypothetical protein